MNIFDLIGKLEDVFFDGTVALKGKLDGKIETIDLNEEDKVFLMWAINLHMAKERASCAWHKHRSVMSFSCRSCGMDPRACDYCHEYPCEKECNTP